MSARVTPVLWQLSTSIFSEKARWALEHKRIQYETKDLLPGAHGLILKLRRRGGTVPALDIDGRTVRDSTAIIAALEELRPDPPLYPDGGDARAEALALEDFFDEQCGHEVRRVFLDVVLRYPDLAVSVFGSGYPRALQSAAKATHRLTDRFNRVKYGIDASRVAEARRRVADALSRIESQLGGSRYLVGDRFSVADLTGAAILAPLVMPAEYPNPWWNDRPVPPELQAVREELAGSPAFEWVLEMYRNHRAPAGGG